MNKVILVGNLGRDPEVRGTALANASIATTFTWKDRDEVEWHRVAFCGRLAEIAGEYLKKGSQVYVEGRLRTRKRKDKESGADRYTTEIVAETMQMLGSRGDVGAARQGKEPVREKDPWELNPSKAPDALGLIGSRDDYPF